MPMTYDRAVAPLAKVHKNLQKFINQAETIRDSNEEELVYVQETYEITKHRLTLANEMISMELERANAMIKNLNTLL